MKYEDTIVKKGKYANWLDISVASILNYTVGYKDSRKAQNWQDVEEEAHNLNLQEDIFRQGEDLYGFDGMLEEAVAHVKKETKLMKLDAYIDEIKAEVIRACADAFQDKYMTESFDWVAGQIKDLIDKALEDELGKYQLLYYSEEDKTLHSEFKYNTDSIRIYASRQQIKKYAEYHFNIEDLTFDEILGELPYYISAGEIKWEHFDYYGTRGDCDDWYVYFKDGTEVAYTIREDLKKKQRKVKALIKNKVSLNKREVSYA